jgi:hypothetical protein
MRSVSTGIRAASPSKYTEDDARRAGFTLIEALVALSLVLGFAATLGPFMFQSHRILVQGDGQVRAELFLRSLLATPFDRAHPELGVRTGENGGLLWRVDVEPLSEDVAPSASSRSSASGAKKKNEANWALYQVKARVVSMSGQIVSGESLRLGQVE